MLKQASSNILLTRAYSFGSIVFFDLMHLEVR